MLRRRLRPRRDPRAAPRLLDRVAPGAFARGAARAHPICRNAAGTACHRQLDPPAARRCAGAPARLRARVPPTAPRRISALRLPAALQRPLGELQQPLRAEQQDLRGGLRERVSGLCGWVPVAHRGAEKSAIRYRRSTVRSKNGSRRACSRSGAPSPRHQKSTCD